MRVRMEKVDGETSPGMDHSPEVNEGYWIEGTLVGMVSEGHPVTVLRDMRNGKFVAGMFQTSFIRSVEGEPGGPYVLHTQNSVWRMTVLGEG